MLDALADIVIFLQDNIWLIFIIVAFFVINIFLRRNNRYSWFNLIKSTKPVDSTVNSKVLNKGLWIYWIIIIIFILVFKHWFWWY